ncbi:MAG: hypothetical protein IIA00_04835, partial [Proteobacteria bacterium]|nr:hypothetical protein [Pseudomonadota bacterium]
GRSLGADRRALTPHGLAVQSDAIKPTHRPAGNGEGAVDVEITDDH